MKIRNSNKRGYTIVELTIVMVIIGMVFALGIQMYQKERTSFVINKQLNDVLLMIKEARNLAITSEPYYVNSSVGNITPADGYGVHFNMAPTGNQANVSLFINIDGGNPGAINDDVPDQLDANDVILKTVTFHPLLQPEWFYFDGVEQSIAGSPKTINGETEAVIIFKPPLATTNVNNNGGTSLSTLQVKLLNLHLPANSPRACPRIDINHIRAFASLEYDPVCP